MKSSAKSAGVGQNACGPSELKVPFPAATGLAKGVQGKGRGGGERGRAKRLSRTAFRNFRRFGTGVADKDVKRETANVRREKQETEYRIQNTGEKPICLFSCLLSPVSCILPFRLPSAISS
jgi:hypothetical protein